MNAEHPFELRLVAPPDWCGLVMTKPAVARECVFDITDAIELAERDYRTIEVDGRHLLHPVGCFINHSCDPTTEFVNDEHGLRFLARRRLGPGDQITFDYATTESSIERPFDCRCGAENCRGRVG